MQRIRVWTCSPGNLIGRTRGALSSFADVRPAPDAEITVGDADDWPTADSAGTDVGSCAKSITYEKQHPLYVPCFGDFAER
jgi:hypothetical protein